MYSVIVFDLDGTLIASDNTILNSIKQACQKENINIENIDFTSDIIGPPIQQIAKKLFPYLSEESINNIAKSFRQIYDSSTHQDTILYSGIFDLLDELHTNNKQLFISTNKPQKPTKTIVHNLKIGHFFDDIYTIDGVPNQKMTKSEMLQLILKNNPSKKAVMIGDCLSDIKAAKENGIDSIAVLWGYEKNKEIFKTEATYIANNILELKEILND